MKATGVSPRVPDCKLRPATAMSRLLLGCGAVCLLSCPMNFAWWVGRVSKKWQEEEHPLDTATPAPPKADEKPEDD